MGNNFLPYRTSRATPAATFAKDRQGLGRAVVVLKRMSQPSSLCGGTCLHVGPRRTLPSLSSPEDSTSAWEW